jgi:hypothetical protein
MERMSEQQRNAISRAARAEYERLELESRPARQARAAQKARSAERGLLCYAAIILVLLFACFVWPGSGGGTAGSTAGPVGGYDRSCPYATPLGDDSC